MAQQSSHDPEEAYAGKDLGSRQFVANDETIKNYFEGLNVDPSWYQENKIDGVAVAPSMVLTSVDGGFPGAGFKNNFGTLWIRQEWDMKAPVVPGKEYKVTSQVLDVYEWRNRKVAVQEVTLWSGDGEIMAQGKHHQSFMLDQSSGKVKLRDPKAKEGVRKFAVPEGEALDPVTSNISLEMCGEFFHGSKSYHTSKEAAEELGFEKVVVGGRMTMSYIGDLMDRRFGQGWLAGGHLDVKFTNIVWPDENITAKGVITDRVEEDGRTRANVAVWMEKDDGTVVIVGQASAFEG